MFSVYILWEEIETVGGHGVDGIFRDTTPGLIVVYDTFTSLDRVQ